MKDSAKILSIKEFVENQHEVRMRLVKLIRSKPTPLNHLARKIGIGMNTMRAFALEEKDVDLYRLCVIDNYLTDQGF